MFNHANYTDKLILNELRAFNKKRSAFDTVNSLTLNEFKNKATKVFCRLDGYFRCTRRNFIGENYLYKLKLENDGEIKVVKVEEADFKFKFKNHFTR